MDAPAQFFIRLNGRTHGPLLVDDVCQLVNGRFIGRDTGVAPAADGPWTSLRECPQFAALFASSPHRFECANRDDGAPLDLQALINSAQHPAPRVQLVAKAVSTTPAEHDVHALLGLNRRVEQRHGLYAIETSPARPSRRRRDYFRLLAVIGVAIFSVLIVVSFIAVQVQVLGARMPDQLWPMFTHMLFHSPILAWGVAAFAFYAIALGWVMFGVMDDY